jgi:peptidoglycan/LPS O-acetylase OafA/YrhL
VIGSTSQKVSSPRFWTLDVVRGLAILGVIGFHVLPQEQQAIEPAIAWLKYGGTFGVSLFFVLSGFSIHLSQLRRPVTNQIQWNQFFLRRLRRLYPPYLAAIILSITVNIIWFFLRGHNLYLPSLGDLIAHLLLLHTLHPQTFFGIIPALWFIGVLAHLYLLYPVLLRIISFFGINRALLIVLGVTLSARLLSQSFISMSSSPEWATFLQSNAPQRWFEWCLGAWTATKINQKNTPSTLFFTLSLLLLPTWLMFGSSSTLFYEPFLGIFLSNLIWFLSFHESKWHFYSFWLPLFSLGQLSYAIYLVHQIFVPYIRSGVGLISSFTMPSLLLTLTGVLLITLPISIFFSYFLEKPFALKSGQ